MKNKSIAPILPILMLICTGFGLNARAADSGEICKGTTVYTVISGSYWIGEVQEVFDHDTAEVKMGLKDGTPYSGNLQYLTLSTLMPEGGCVGPNKICEGDTIYVHEDNGDVLIGKSTRTFGGNPDGILYYSTQVVESNCTTLNGGPCKEKKLFYWNANSGSVEKQSGCSGSNCSGKSKSN